MNLSFFNCMKFTCLVSLIVVGLSVYKINNEGLKYGIEFMGGTEAVSYTHLRAHETLR